MSGKTVADLPARFTIQRISAPASPRRYLAIADDGTRGWADGLQGVALFQSRAAADEFHRFRMGGTEDAVIVRHTVQ